jgi:hypothetical protein
MAPIAPYKWLYIIFVIVTTAIGVLGVRAVVLLIKGHPNAHRCSIIALLLGILVGAIHMAASRALRGSSMPVDGVVYTTVLTLIVFLIFRIPKVSELVDFEKTPDDDSGPMAAAITLLLSGAQFLTVQYWAGPTHTWDGVNWADAWHLSMALLGWGLELSGMGTLIIPLIRHKGTEPIPAAVPGQQP